MAKKTNIAQSTGQKIYKYMGVPSTQKIFFVRHLSVMLKAGIPLSRALKTLAVQADNRRMKEILVDLASKVEKGGTFSESLWLYPSIFSEFFVSMVQSGELTGNLEEILNELYVQMKKDHELISKVKGALTYPIIVVIAMIAVSIGMITFVIPRITGIFKEVNIELPIATRILIGISDFVTNNGILVGVGSLLLLIGSIKFIRSKWGKPIWHSFLLKVPIISGTIKKINLARFSRTLSALLRTNIPISKTLSTAADVLTNHRYRKTLMDASEKIERGVLLSEIMDKSPELFPPLVVQMVQVGEQTGTLDTIVEEVANFYEEEVSSLFNNLASVIEPVLILILGVGVAFIAIAVIMPIYTISQSI